MLGVTRVVQGLTGVAVAVAPQPQRGCRAGRLPPRLGLPRQKHFAISGTRTRVSRVGGVDHTPRLGTNSQRRRFYRDWQVCWLAQERIVEITS